MAHRVFLTISGKLTLLHSGTSGHRAVAHYLPTGSIDDLNGRESKGLRGLWQAVRGLLRKYSGLG